MIKGVIFDLDGVLVFTDKYHYLAWKVIADKEGIYFDEIINNRLRGVSRMESLEIVLEKSNKSYSKKEKELMAFEKNEIYKESLNQLSSKDVSDDVLVTLKELKKNNIKLAIGSSSKNTRLILKKIGIIDYFDEIVDGNCISNSKPHPEVFEKAANRLGLDSSECLVIEDAESGVDAAIAANIKVCGIGDASKYSKTTYPISSIKDLLKYVL
ncbi:MAG: beta-phosphoglucomutase [Bacilli bacterium]|nr:beta-phosphoglucomutase [Bacilli bacterium]